MADKITIKLKTLDNQVNEITVSKDISGLDLKKIIHDIMSMDVDSIKLIYKGKQITNSQKLSDHVTQNNEIVHVMGGKPKAKPQQENEPKVENLHNTNIPNIDLRNQPNQPPKFDINSMLNNMMQNPSIIQMATQIATGQSLNKSGSKEGGNPFNNLMGLLGSGNTNSFQPQIEEEKNVENPVKKSISLPFQSLQKIGNISDKLMGENATFPGPNRPILNYERNNLSILGGYLSKLYFNILRILPFIGRLGDLMERESLITNEIERKEIEKLSQNLGNAFSEINKAIQPLPSILENLKIGKNTGESQILENSSNANNNEPELNQIVKNEVPSNTKTNPSTTNPEMDFNSILSEMTKPQNMKNMMNVVGSMMNNQNGEPDLGGMLNMIGPMISQLEGGKSGKGGGMLDMLNMFAGGKSQKKPKTNNDSKLGDILNEILQEDPKTDSELLDILLGLSMNEIIQISNGKFDPVYKIRQDLREIVESKKQTNKNIADTYAKLHASYFIIPSQLKDKLVPSIDPISNIEECLKNHYMSYVSLFVNNEISDSEFSSRFKLIFTLIIGDVISKLNEGFNGDNSISLQFIKLNLDRNVLDTYEEAGIILKSIGGIDHIMKLITNTYSNFLNEKDNLLESYKQTKPKIEIKWEEILKFSEIDEKRQQEINLNLIKSEKLDEQKEFFTENYRGTYVYK